MRPLIYIGAPYSHPEPAVITARMDYVAEYMAECVMRGELVVSPLLFHFTLEKNPELGADWDAWKFYSECLLIQCSEMRVLHLDGWHTSKGLNAEMQFAKQHCIKITSVDPALEALLKGQQ